MLLAAPGSEAMMAGTTLGALAAIAVILAIAARTGFGPERLLLAGIAVGAFCLALLTAVLASGDRNAFTLLAWMAGSTDRITLSQALVTAGAALVLIAPLPLLGRWLDLLPLGSAASHALGLPVAGSRFILALAAALMAALASLMVGPLSLVGLVGPHLARLLGFARGGPQVVAAALIGAVLLLGVDWLGRTVAFPYQIPTGLLASLVGGPYLLWLLRRGGSTSA
jgi:iron complex transport system permease protein